MAVRKMVRGEEKYKTPGAAGVNQRADHQMLS